MTIQQNAGETKGKFYIEMDGIKKAKITYSKLGTRQIIIDHTEVSDELRGKNAGKLLVEHTITHAREHNLKVIPLCPFAKSIIDRNPKLQDVLRK